MIAINVPQPTFEVGQLVQHRRYGYRGVVVEIDPTCQAPGEWYQANQTQPLREQPWYHVIVDGRDSTTYPAQSSLRIAADKSPIENPLIALFFHDFLRGRYQRNEVPFQGW